MGYLMNFIERVKNSDLIRDNIILFVGNFLLGVCGYFFHFYMGRVLGPIDYGVLGVLLSILYFVAVFVNAIQLSITKFVSEIKNENNKISFLLINSIKRLFTYSVIIFISFLILVPFLMDFLKIPRLSLIIALSSFIPMFVLPITRGTLQGLQLFKPLSVNLILEGILRISLGIILVYIGFGVNGAIGALIFGFALAFLLSLIPLRKYFKQMREKIDTKRVYKYAFPVIVTLFTLTAFYTLDLVLVKHFFDALNAGYYAAVSLLGKIIFFGTMSISLVMFPKVSENHLSNKDSKPILYKSLGLVSLFGIFVTLFYFLFPRFTVNLLFGRDYLTIAPLIGLFALFMTLFSLVYAISFYYLSINRIKFIIWLILFVLIELILILFYHETLLQIIWILVILSFLLFLILFLGVKWK